MQRVVFTVLKIYKNFVKLYIYIYIYVYTYTHTYIATRSVTPCL